MTKIKLIRILSGLLLAGVLLIEGLAFALVYRLNMLPNEYLVLLAAFLLVMWVILSAVLLIPGKKKRLPGKGRTIAVVLVVAMIVGGCGVAAKVASDVHETLQHISGTTELAATVYVYVRAEDPAQTLADAKGYHFATAESYDVENTRKAIGLMEDELGTQLNTADYANVLAAAEALLIREADALIVNSAYISILEELEGYTDFSTRARLLKQVDILVEVEPDDDVKNPFDWLFPDNDEDDPDTTGPGGETQPVESDTAIKIPDGEVTETPFVVYLAGSDYEKGGLATWTRNDVNILAVVNPMTKQVLLVNTPRDYYVPNPAGGGALDKLTHCGVQTVENSVAAMSQFYEVPIRYYGQVGFDGLKGLVDAVDGVTVYSEVSYMAMDQTWIQKGENHLNGEQALHFARERKNIDGGDNARGNNQMKIIKALINKLISGKIITRYSEILGSLKNLFRTNMSAEDMASLVQMQLSDMASWNIVSYAVTGEAAYRETYSMPGQNLYVYVPNMDTVEYAKELMQRVVDGEIINQSDIIPAE